MIKVYVAGPYSADNVIDVLKNIGKGQNYCAQLFSAGFAPFCPWHDKSFVTDRPYNSYTVDQFYEYSIAWLKVSDVMLLIDGWKESKGTLAKIEIAEKSNIPIFDNISDLCSWRENVER